ncbi:MAG: TIM barrel protein [Intestinibacillus sp.]
MEPRFGPAGNAQSFADAGFKATVDAPRWLAAQGLTAYEYQCGRGVNVGEETAARIGAQAAQYGIALSIHTPYFINLSSDELERIEKNAGYVLASCRVARAMGAKRLTVHCGGQGKLSRERAMANTAKNLQNILALMEEEGFGGQTICLETMGKQSVLGSAEEVCALVAQDDRLLPCIDFGHLNARTGGGYRQPGDFARLFDLMENTIGADRTRVFHSHFSKIEYGDKGEKRHLTFADTVYGPDFAPIAELTAVRGYTPTFICESAGTQAEDAATMKQLYEGARRK